MSDPESVRYTWRVLRAGRFRLDGGSMFGLIPRTVWSRSVTSDDKGRIEVQHNCLLLEGGGRRILIEAGTGDKLDDASRELFVMERRTVLDALREASCDPQTISHVIVSHLHFDHAGGLTRLPHAGEKPEWTGPASGMAGRRPDHGVVRSFPGAKVVVQRREWEDALRGASVMTRTYFADHIEPLRERLMLVDSPAPFSPGATPGRDELPMLTLDQRATRVLPGVRVLRVPGHTWGQQAVLFEDVKGRTIAFTPDVLPTAAHLGAAYSLGYDVEPYTSMVTKHWYLSHAADFGWVLVLDHEPGNPCFSVRRNGKGWFELTPAPD
jgi:glyoxylase-like metal-dependent hydrolase (beta-lactamase superfamily II)